MSEDRRHGKRALWFIAGLVIALFIQDRLTSDEATDENYIVEHQSQVGQRGNNESMQGWPDAAYQQPPGSGMVPQEFDRTNEESIRRDERRRIEEKRWNSTSRGDQEF